MGASSAVIADIYKWVDQNGKVHYEDRPSRGQPATKVAVPKAGAAAAEDAPQRTPSESKAITNAVRANPQSNQMRSGPPRTAPTTGITADSTQKAIADCKANRGVDCSKPEVISQWARQNTPATKQEIEAQQRAGAARNRQKIDAEFQRRLERTRDIEGLRNQGR